LGECEKADAKGQDNLKKPDMSTSEIIDIRYEKIHVFEVGQQPKVACNSQDENKLGLGILSA